MPFFVNSAVLECEWNGEICTKVLSLTPVNRPKEKITVAGKPLNYVNTATGYLIFANISQMSYIPTGMFTVFPNLTSLDMLNTSLNNLVTNAFGSCSKLDQWLVINHNITMLPAAFAQNCQYARRFIIINGQIEKIDVNAFKGLTSMEEINLSRNMIKCIPPGLFQNVPLINTIRLENNQITALDSNVFIDLTHLLSIHLASNLLTYLPIFNLSATINLLDVNMNQISAVNPGYISLYNGTNKNTYTVYLANSTCATRLNVILIKVLYPTFVSWIQKCLDNWLPSMTTSVTCFEPTTLAPSTTVTASKSGPRKCHGKNCRKKCRPL